MSGNERKAIDIAGRQGALLTAVEVGLGSILHAFKLPFSGQFLSLNQGFILTRASLQCRGQRGERTIALYVSNIAAVLKSLSPAGKKLTPMLAISAQGLLYTFGTALFGVNPVGVCVGMVLLSVWAFIQPVLIYWLLFGKTLLYMADYFFEKLSQSIAFEVQDLAWVLALVVGVKLLVSLVVGLVAYYLPEQSVRRYQATLLKAGQSRRRQIEIQHARVSPWQTARLAARDLLNPLFLISLALTVAFFLLSEVEGVGVLWALLRPVAVGFLLFFLIRAVSFDWIYSQLQRAGLRGFGQSLQTAIQTLKEI